MKNILGISAFYHDSAACLLKNGKIIAAAQEERFSRQNHDPRYPYHAIEFVLKYSKMKLSEQLGVKILPTTLILDKSVNEIARVEGYIDWKKTENRNVIENVLSR